MSTNGVPIKDVNPMEIKSIEIHYIGLRVPFKLAN